MSYFYGYFFELDAPKCCFYLYDPRGMIILCFVHKIINDLVLWTHYEKNVHYNALYGFKYV